MKTVSAPAKLLALDGNTAVSPAEYILPVACSTIGRAETCELVVDRPEVSRLHATIEREGRRYLLRDAGSENGTFLNGRRMLRPLHLNHRDVIGVGGPEPLLRFLDPDQTYRQTPPLCYEASRLTFVLNNQEVALSPQQFKLLHFLH